MMPRIGIDVTFVIKTKDATAIWTGIHVPLISGHKQKVADLPYTNV